MEKDQIIQRMYGYGVVPVVVIEDSAQALPAADALAKGGLPIMEITLRTDAALDSIRAVRRQRPDVLVGAGTVLTLEQCKESVEAGAQFIVSPGFDAEMVRWCAEKGIPVTPGCVTPTEIMAALALGVDIIKFFPAQIYGGLAAMKALSGPFRQVRFIPTGGVNAENLHTYMETPFVFAAGGSWICASVDLKSGNFDEIERKAAEAVRVVRAAR